MTDHITPQEARDMLDAATPGPWRSDEETGEIHDTNGKQVAYPGSWNGIEENWIEWRFDADHILAAAAPDMARMLAGARVETRGVGQIIPGSDSLLTSTGWSEDESNSRRTWQFPPECWRIETRLIIDLPEEEA